MRPVPPAVREVIAARASEVTEPFAVAFAEPALRRPVDLVSSATDSPRYFRVVANGTTAAYVRPRKDHIMVEYRLPNDHWSYGWGFGFDGAFGPSIALRINGQTSFDVSMRLLDDALRMLSAASD